MTNKNKPNTSQNQDCDNSDKTILISEISPDSDNETLIKHTSNHTLQKEKDNTLLQETDLNPDNKTVISKASKTGSLLKNRFDLLEVIGSGGMGTVYKSLDRRDIEAGNSSFIAIKIINDEYKNDPDLLKALHSETRKTQALAHPNIVTVFDFDRDQDTVFMTMEFIDGAPLDNVITANPKGMPPNKALKIISKMAQALIYAHSKDIIHLDFKPNNIFVDTKGHVKVFDFGIARLTNSALSRSFDASVLGGLTPSYASLEMFNNEAPDPRDDIYALACVSYELLSGHHPFNKIAATIAQEKNLKPEKIKSLNNKQWNTLKQALAFNRKDRIQDVNTFLAGMNSNPGLSPYIITLTAIISVVAISLILYFFQPEYSSLFLPKENDSFSIVSKIDTISTEPADQRQLDKKPLEISKELGNISISTKKTNYKIGENLQLSFKVDSPMYIKVATINSEGKLIVLFPNPYQPNNYCEPNTTYQIPPKNAEFSLDIGEPRGVDRIVAIGSANPIPSQALNFTSTGQISDPKLRQSLIYKSISYTIN